MDRKTFLNDLRTLLVKATGATNPKPLDVLKSAGAKVETLAKGIEGDTVPEATAGELSALVKSIAKLAPSILPDRVGTTKAELDAYTAAKVTLSTLSECVWGMQDAFRDGAVDAVKMHAEKMKLAIDNVVSMLGEAAAPPAAAAAGAPPAEKSDGVGEITPAQFVAWAQTQMSEAVKTADVAKLEAIIKAVRIAKQSFVDEGLPTLPMDKFEAFPGTGGGAKMDLTANSDQSTKEGNVLNMDAADGDSAFAANTSQVMKQIEEMLAKLDEPEPAKKGEEAYSWPMDMAMPDPVAPPPEPVQKSAGERDGGFGRDPWDAQPSFPPTR